MAATPVTSKSSTPVTRRTPNSIDATWASYFGKLEDTTEQVEQNADGPSWQRSDWPQAANGELVSALDGNWGEIQVKVQKVLVEKAKVAAAPAPTPVDVLQATRESVSDAAGA